MFFVPGAAFMETRDVPHGAVASVTYYSKTLEKFRRMHVYTRPATRPAAASIRCFIFCTARAIATIPGLGGRAGFILDNLIAAGKAKPMVVVMPAGHTTQTMNFGGRGGRLPFDDDFVKDFNNDIMPYAESHYRLQPGRAHRAIAGLSMGGGHTSISRFRISINLPTSACSARDCSASPAEDARRTCSEGPNPVTMWEQQNKAVLDNPRSRRT